MFFAEHRSAKDIDLGTGQLFVEQVAVLPDSRTFCRLSTYPHSRFCYCSRNNRITDKGSLVIDAKWSEVNVDRTDLVISRLESSHLPESAFMELAVVSLPIR